MIRCFRYCISAMEAGAIGMVAGMLGELQAAVVFREIDEVSFFVTLFSMILFVSVCVKVEINQYCRQRRKNRELQNKNLLKKY